MEPDSESEGAPWTPWASPRARARSPSLWACIAHDHAHTWVLFDRFKLAADQGSEHGMELTAAALATDLRLQAQAEMDVLYPAVEASGVRWPGDLVRGAWRTGEAVESGVLEVLTLRRERNWAGLAQRVELLRKYFEAHAVEAHARLLPALAGRADANEDDDELRELGRRWRAAQATAPLEPASQAAAEAEAAAMRAGFATRGE